ncbi:MAG: right-handed parallel beta-helix repeat-containing protein [Candidatus Cloacimonetes bacterium]|nr:right-handed parallel beta-helix repeat-containing protein [Candidatus Cloacimonadota bacterium]
MKKTLLIVLLMCPFFIKAIIINIPDDFPTIQQGIDSAIDSDTIMVQPGNYFENIDYNGKNITIGSLFLTTQDTTYITETVINGNQSGSVVTFENGEDSTAVLIGFTVTNGSGSYADPIGSGLYFFWGGGIYCYYSNPVIRSIIISDNSSDYGGGISLVNSNPILDDLTILNNFADSGGGGITCGWNSNPRMKNIRIADNSAEGAGGGIHFAYEANPNISNLIVSGNSAGNNGGGIVCFYSSPILKTVKIVNNSTDFGAGISISHSNSILENVLISNNSANNFAGGFLMTNSNPILSNVTISHNWAHHSSSGIYCLDNSNPQLFNSILWNLSSVEIYFYYGYAPNSITIAYSDIKGGESGIVTNNNGTVYWLEGNFDEDPQFVEPYEENFHLQDNSPCIGAGIEEIEINGSLYYSPEFDIEGNPRPNPHGSMPDLGAYENPLGEPIVGLENIKSSIFNIQLSNHPNPFNSETTITFSLTAKDAKNAKIEIYNLKGQKVKTFPNPQINKSSNQQIIWDGTDDNNKPVSSGIYLYKLKVNDKTLAARKCILLK